MISERSERHPVDRLAEEFVARYRSGERPSISEYAGRYPDLAGELQELLSALVLIEEHGPAGAAPLGHDDVGGEGDLATNDRIPDQLGEYRILREIGRGGMGFVYEAVQESLGRHVALKVLPVPTPMDPTRLKRFQREVQAAARLHHTNIVPVFGVGEWRAGDMSSPVHYYAMQFIPGRGLDKVIDELRQLRAKSDTETRRHGDTEHPSAAASERPGVPVSVGADLSTQSDTPRYYRSVARLGEQVAEALAHAHRQGILHRDIKPGNLLLDGQGTVWVTDFGLAAGEGMEELTHTGDVVGTLRYMAPERLQGQGDARADVYSLGLTLYELLTLRPAFDASDRAALVRQIAQDSPPRPRRLDPRIPRDLETIVLKACAKEASRRYATASELAEDLRRFLGDRPIEARRTPWWEHAWRWCRRNPGIAAASATAVAALLIGLAISLWQWRRADDNFQQAEASAAQAEKDFQLALQAINQMLERVGADRLEAVPHMDQTRRALLQDAVRFYQALLREREDKPKGRLAMARAYWRLGQIQGSLSEGRQAVPSFDQALALVRGLLNDNSNDVETRRLEAVIYAYRGVVKDRLLQQPSEAEADYWQALAVWDRLTAEWPDQQGVAGDRTQTLLFLGNLLRSTSRPAEAESCIRRAIEMAEGLPAEHRHRSRLLANGHNILSVILDAKGDSTEAERLHRRALEFFERSARENPEPYRRQELAFALRGLAQFQVRSPATRREAEKSYQRSLRLSERLSADFPDVPFYRDGLATTAYSYGALLLALRPKEAEAMFERAASLWKELAAKSPESPLYRVGLGGAIHNLAQERQKRGELATACTMLEEALGHQEAAVKANHKEDNALEFLGNHYEELVKLLLKLGQPQEAEKFVLRQMATAQELAAKDGQSPLVRVFQARSYENLARLRNTINQLDETAEARREAAGHWRRLAADFPGNPDYASKLGANLNDWAIVLNKQGRASEMVPLLDEAILLQEAALRARPNQPSYGQFLYNHHFNLANAHLVLGNHAAIAAAASALRDRFPDLFNDYWWAFFLARCIPLAENDPHLSPEERVRLAGEYADQAMSFLQAAQQKKSKDLSSIHTHPAFQPLRGRPDFQGMLAEVPGPAR